MSAEKTKSPIMKFLPLIIIAGGFALAYFMGWFKYLDPQLIVDNADYLQDLVANNFLLVLIGFIVAYACLLYTSPSPRDQRGSRMPSSA